MFDYVYISEFKAPRYEIVDEQAITYPDEMIFILLKDNRKDMYNFYITDHYDEHIIFEDSSRHKIWVFIKTHESEPYETAKDFYPWLKKSQYGF